MGTPPDADGMAALNTPAPDFPRPPLARSSSAAIFWSVALLLLAVGAWRGWAWWQA